MSVCATNSNIHKTVTIILINCFNQETTLTIFIHTLSYLMIPTSLLLHFDDEQNINVEN